MKNKSKYHSLKVAVALILIAVAALAVTYAVQSFGNRFEGSMTVPEAQSFVDSELAKLPNSVAVGAKYVAENSKVTVNDISFGNERNVILDCTYETLNVGSVVSENVDKYVSDAYAFCIDNEQKGVKTNATKVKLHLAEMLEEDIGKSEIISGEIQLEIFDVGGKYILNLSDEIVNTVFGGILDAQKNILSTDTAIYNGETVSIASKNTLRNGISDCLKLINYDSSKPDTSIPLVKAWNGIKYDFTRNFINNNQWKYLANGLLTTLEITFLAVLLGIVIGFLVAVIRCTNQKTGKLELISGICKIYLSVMRGTPVMVQLLIVYFVVLLPIGVEKFPAAVLCFGLNSGAYVSEIVRGGIMSIDEGQTEAGRSLGFTYMQTMLYIIIPQAFKAVLPSLANEFIALLKESSVAFYIGVADLTQGGLKIRSITYSNYMPLLAVAIIYLVLVLGLSKCVSLLERRLHKGDTR